MVIVKADRRGDAFTGGEPRAEGRDSAADGTAASTQVQWQAVWDVGLFGQQGTLPTRTGCQARQTGDNGRGSCEGLADPVLKYRSSCRALASVSTAMLWADGPWSKSHSPICAVRN